MPAPKPTKRLSPGCLALFGLPFALVGLGLLGWTAIGVARWYAAQTWAAVPATVLAAELVENRGDDSTTYKATASYRYEYEGREYTATRVALREGADNIGDFQQRLHAELDSAQRRGATVTAYVDPGEPSAAVLNRELRPGLLLLQSAMGLVFAAVGVGLIVATRYGTKKLAAENAQRARHPDEPWRWRPDWASGRIASNTHGAAYVAIGFAVFWNLVSIPAAAFVPGEIADGNHIAALALLFPLIGLGLAAWAIRAWLQLRRYKVATFTMPAGPVVAGGRLKGTVRVEAEVPVANEFRVELACVEERIRGSGKNRDRSERLLWQREWRVPRHQCQVTPAFTTIPVDTLVPRDQPLTDTSSADDRRTITWRLDVTGECPGPDFWSRFELPVFALAPESHAEPVPAAVAARRTKLDTGTLASHGIDYVRTAAGQESWTFRRGRHKGFALAITLFSAVWTATAVAFLLADVPIAVPIVLLVFDTLFVAWALSLWLTEHRVTLDRGLLTLERRGFLPRKPIEVPLQWLRGARAQRGMQAGNKLYYDLKVETSDGVHTAATSVADYDVASALAAHWLAGRNGATAAAQR
jgi:hypothetical protein